MSGVGRGQNQDKVLTWWEQRLSPQEKLKLVDTGRGLHSSFGKKTRLETELEFWQFRWSAQCTQDVLLFLHLFAILLLPTGPFRDSWCLILVCDSFNLTRTVPETTGLGLTMEPDEATSGCQLTPPLSDSISKKQFYSKGQGTLSPSSTMSVCVCLRTSPLLCGSSANFQRWWEFLIAMVVHCPKRCEISIQTSEALLLTHNLLHKGKGEVLDNFSFLNSTLVSGCHILAVTPYNIHCHFKHWIQTLVLS